MKQKTKQIVALCLDIAVFALMVLSVFFMMFGVQFMGEDLALVASKAEAFKFFTVDSNVLMGLIALLYAVYLVLLLAGKIDAIPHWLHVLKLVGTVGVSLTFLTVVAFLAPFVAPTFWSLFNNASFFMHFLTPVLSIVVYVFFEDTDDVRFRETFWGLVPMGVYAIFYSVNALTHAVDGKVPYEYDWYAFVQGGVWQMAIALPLMLVATYLIALVLWVGNLGVCRARIRRSHE